MCTANSKKYQLTLHAPLVVPTCIRNRRRAARILCRRPSLDTAWPLAQILQPMNVQALILNKSPA